MTPVSKNLAHHARHASLWSGIDGVLKALLGFGITIALARLVSPSEFGTVAMILVFSAIASVLIDSGLSTALIQRQDVTHIDESTAFYFNLGVSVLLAVILAVAASWIARFFGQPALTGIARVMAVNLVVSALGAIHTTLLAKELNFRPLMFISLWAMLLSGTLAIYLASRGFGVWSLAWQILAQTTVSTILLWTWHQWRPLSVFDRVALRRLLTFGGHVMAANIIDAVYTRLYSVFVGKLYNASDLGFYTRAQTTQQLPTSLLANMLNRVALPTFSRTSDDPAALARALAKTSRLLMFVNLPLMAGLAVTARPLVEGLFGRNWLPAVPLLQVLCIVGALWPLQILNVSALLAQGHSRLLLRIELVKKGFGVLALVLASPFGLLVIAWSQVVAACMAFFVNSHYSGRLLGFGAWAQIRVLGRSIVASIAMLLIVAIAQHLLPWSPLSQLALLVPLGMGVYLLASIVLGVAQLREFGAALGLMRDSRSGGTG